MKEINYLQLLLTKAWDKSFDEELSLDMTSEKGFKNKLYQFKARIEAQTGIQLVDVRSIRNHIKAILNESENNLPSIKTVEILCWYVLGKPSIEKSELQNWEQKDFRIRELWERFKSTSENLPEFAQVPQSKNNPRRVIASETKSKKTLFYTIMGLGILGIIAFSFLINRKSAVENRSFHKRFTNSNLDSLQKEGWFLFPDSIDEAGFIKDNGNNNNGYLTLRTFLGDSFLVNRKYKPKVINILGHPLSCGDCCEIKLKIVDFNPYQRYQQAGFFLFYREIPYPSVRMTLHFNSGRSSGEISIISRDDEYSNEHLIKNQTHNIRALVYDVEDQEVINPIDSIVLKVRIEDDQYFFSHKVENREFIDITSEKLLFPKPKYIGLAAFQGRPDIPFPVYPVTEFLPAYFEYVEVKPCAE